MSEIDLLVKEGLLSKKVLAQVKRAAKRKADQLKTLRKFYDARARKAFQKYLKNGRSWKGIEAERAIFRAYMTKRHALHERIARLVPEPVEPEWDSP